VIPAITHLNIYTVGHNYSCNLYFVLLLFLPTQTPILSALFLVFGFISKPISNITDSDAHWLQISVYMHFLYFIFIDIIIILAQLPVSILAHVIVL